VTEDEGVARSSIGKAPSGTRSSLIVTLVGLSGLFVLTLWLTVKMLATPAAPGSLVVGHSRIDA
jgi:hypothetical protein